MFALMCAVLYKTPNIENQDVAAYDIELTCYLYLETRIGLENKVETTCFRRKRILRFAPPLGTSETFKCYFHVTVS